MEESVVVISLLVVITFPAPNLDFSFEPSV